MSSTEKGRLSTPEGFICGGIAACIAVTISNPAEVAKTRLQLQGELAKGGEKKVYKSALDVFSKTWKNEGIRGMQRGLGPAYAYQILLNGSRLGFYEPFRHAINDFIGRAPNEQIPITSVIAGATSGAVGASLGNPLFLIKARMQAYSPALPVGAQHYYKNSFDALSTIYRQEKFRGLVRGIDAAILRTSMGSSVQLPSYNFTKNQLVKHGILPDNSTWTFLASSTVSGMCVCMAMQPADTALTRMYNQPTKRNEAGKVVGVLYRNPIDCLWKTFKTEGVRGWYKGTTAHFLRIAPHTIVTLTANDLIINLYKSIKHRNS
ncbi:related to OAC1-similarity to mitochondrial uncoupling proteins (MCF) [Armillaria ostoyae]|uniref:Related to OAC1-similarity to mitochondrial uncoupling proteins (MCF) n=3 Tax=Armillaria TaxID=47424 RepID=A0A284RBJ3_ARMOS|nr:mitochondrial carrier domain-containing protein [Armillaria borealis]PBK76851.1 mitochondrial carrier [Armillaria solidipes]SJL06134.1 related to OAC1-similarity to mitochondrial uncoupling proteins (MCF) [Armillaria ostoyae]